MRPGVMAAVASLVLAAGCSALVHGEMRDGAAGDGDPDVASDASDPGNDLRPADPGEGDGDAGQDAPDARDLPAADPASEVSDPCDDDDPCTQDLPTGPDACTHAPHPDRTPCGDRRICLEGTCVGTCLEGLCPTGLGLFDGCRCPAVPGGLTAEQSSDVTWWTVCSADSDGLGRQEACVTPGPTLFRDLADGTVVDGTTGLVWAREPSPVLGLVEADAWCAAGTAGLPGRGWRAPDARELLSVVHLGATGCPWWDPAFGTACPEGERRLWTSTPTAAGRFVVEDGLLVVAGAEVTGRVRCVRSGPRADPSDRWMGPASEGWFDRVTGLLWMATPQSTSGGWLTALSACAQWKGGRLATAKEWATVLDWGGDRCPQVVGPLAGASCGSVTRFWTGTPWPAQGSSRILAWDVAEATLQPADADDSLGIWCVAEPDWGRDPRRHPPESGYLASGGGMNVLRAGGGSVAAMSGGGWIVAWQSQWNVHEPSEIRARRFDEDGAPTATVDPFGMPQLDLYGPALGADPGGGFVVVVDAVAGGARGAWRRAFREDLSAEMPIRVGPDADWLQGATVLGGERALAAWARRCNPLDGGACGGESTIEFEELAPAGEKGAGPYAAGDPGPWQRSGPALAWRKGGIVVAWIGPSPGSTRDDVRYHLWDSSRIAAAPFASRGSDRVANTWTGGPAGPPAAASRGDGFVLAWSAEGRDGSGHGIVARCFGDDGEPQGDEIPVNGFTAGRQDHPAVAATGDGGFLVAWESGCGVDDPGTEGCAAMPDGSATAIHARRFDRDGVPDGPEFRVNAWTTGLQMHPGVVATGTGQAVVAWTSYSLSPGRWDARVRRLEEGCADGADNDRDGATDCADPDCAGRTCPDEGDPCTVDRCDTVDGCTHREITGCRRAP